jgi:hypothetical protein
MPIILPKPISVPVADLVAGRVKLLFDGERVSVFNPPHGVRAQDAKLGTDAGHQPTVDRRRARDEDYFDYEGDDPPHVKILDLLAGKVPPEVLDEVRNLLRMNPRDEEEPVGDDPPDFAGKPIPGGTMVPADARRAFDAALATLKPKHAQKVRAALHRQQLAADAALAHARARPATPQIGRVRELMGRIKFAL